jgi:hypothetical protein
MVDCMRRLGYTLHETPFGEWLREIYDHARRSPENVLHAFVPFIHDYVVNEQRPTPEIRLGYGDANTLAGLAESSITCSPVDEMLYNYLTHLIQNGFLPTAQVLCSEVDD